MRYRLCIYKTKAARTGSINAAISIGSIRLWRDGCEAMEHFNSEQIKNQIEAEIGEKCKVFVRYSPKEVKQKEYIYIVTSFDRIKEVLPRVHAIAMENLLVLYDLEANKVYHDNLFDNAFITLKSREDKLKSKIRKQINNIWSFRKIYDYQDAQSKVPCYVITLKKTPGVPFLDRVMTFYTCLNESLDANEKLLCIGRTFCVEGEGYSISFILEGYKKHANVVGFIEDGQAKQELIRRMSIEEIFRWLKGCDEREIDDIHMRMSFSEMEKEFPNLADRLAASIRITKWQRKQIFDIRYSGHGYYGSEILFHLVTDGFDEADKFSVLKIEEESATFILPIINDIYPYIYERYYLTENHIPVEMWEEIIERIKEVRDQVIKGIFNTKLREYIKMFNLFVLGDRNDPRLWSKDEEENIAFVYEHRFEIAHLYDIFIQWSDAQFHHHYCDERMFNIQGP